MGGKTTGKRIRNEEQYEKARVFLIETAVELEDPLLDEQERKRKRALYDHVERLLVAYQRGERVLKYPTLREQYDKLGWEYEELEFKDELVSPELEPMSSEVGETVEETEEEKPSVDLSAWLDD